MTPIRDVDHPDDSIYIEVPECQTRVAQVYSEVYGLTHSIALGVDGLEALILQAQKALEEMTK